MSDGKTPEDNNQKVGESYSKIAVVAGNTQDRKSSPIIRLRTFNNWIKSYLIDMYTPMHGSIFDCACGRGGDINKWALKAPSHIIFADVAELAVAELYTRLRKKNIRKCHYNFIIGDSFGTDVSEMLLKYVSPPISFNLASCQFAFHYAFKDEQTAQQATHNLCNLLAPGGHVIITCPNACRIARLLRETEVYQTEYCKITRKFDPNNIPAFGAAYNFALIGSVDDDEEYLVHPAVIKALFESEGCIEIESSGFHEFYKRNLDFGGKYFYLYQALLKKDDILSSVMTPEEWEVCGLYSFYVFEKVGQERVSLYQDGKQLPPLSNVSFDYIDARTGDLKTFALADYEQKKREMQNQT